jgi:DNA polymerase-3 subunit delta'
MWQVIGQNRAVSLLQRSLEKGTVSHAYLLTGPPHVGKMNLATNLAQALNCEAAIPPCGECAACRKIASGKHADVQIIGLNPDGNSDKAKPRKEIGIEQIREMEHSASLPPFEGKYKVFIIDRAELLSIEAANCLLKTLEEPTGNVIFTLLATNESLLPATVISRCQRLELSPVPTAEIETALNERWSVEPQKAKIISKLCHGCPGWAISAATDDSLLQQRTDRLDELLDIINADYEERFVCANQMATQFSQNRASVQEVLDLWLDYWRDLLLVRVGSGDIITNVDRSDTITEMASGYNLAKIKAFINGIQAAKEQLGLNANPRLALEVLMLSIPEKGKRSGVLPLRDLR